MLVSGRDIIWHDDFQIQWFSGSPIFRHVKGWSMITLCGHAAAERSGIGKWPMNCCGCFPCAESGGPAAGGKSPQHFQTRHPWWGRWQQLLSQQRSGAPKKAATIKRVPIFSRVLRRKGLIFLEATGYRDWFSVVVEKHVCRCHSLRRLPHFIPWHGLKVWHLQDILLGAEVTGPGDLESKDAGCYDGSGWVSRCC